MTQRGFETRIRELVANQPMLQQITRSILLAHATLQWEHNTLHKELLKIVRRDKVCRQYITVGWNAREAYPERSRRCDGRGSSPPRGLRPAEHVLKLAREHAVEALETRETRVTREAAPFLARPRCAEIILDGDLDRPVRRLSYLIEAPGVALSLEG